MWGVGATLSLKPNTIWERQREPELPLAPSQAVLLGWEVLGAPWQGHKSHSVRKEDLCSQLGNDARSVCTYTHSHSLTAKKNQKPNNNKYSSFARSEAGDKVQSQEQLNCFHDFPAAFGRQIGGSCFKCIPNLHFDWLTGHANSMVRYWSVKGIWQFSTIAEMALKQTGESWGEKKKKRYIKKTPPDEWVLSSAKSSPSSQAWGWL